jgi:hypothetical protein
LSACGTPKGAVGARSSAGGTRSSAFGAPKGAVGARSSNRCLRTPGLGGPALRGGLVVEPGRAPPRHPSEEGWFGGSLGRRGWSSRPSEEEVAGPALRWFRAPEGVWGQRSPGGRRSVRGKPRAVRFPPGVALPRKGERLHRGDSTRRERPPGGRAEARLSWPRVGSASAEAPLVRLRGAPPRTARACRGMLGRSLRHVSLVRWARRPSGSLRCAEAPRGAGTFPGHRSAPGFLGPPKRFREGAFLVAQERGAAEGVAPKRAVFPLPWRAEARAGRPHRPQADERDELLSRPWGEPRGGGEDELSGSRNAPGRRLRFGESRNQT